jgi:hypothetical protein
MGLARRLRVEDRLRSVEAAAVIAINAMNLLEEAWEHTVRKPENTIGYVLKRYDPTAFDFAARALEEINLADVPTGS